MRRLFVVANAMGREETISKLIPLLNSHIHQKTELAAEMSHAAAVPMGTEEDDEILLIMAEQLGQIVQCGLVPGYRALAFLPILEELAGVEETVVRDKAVDSLNGIIPLLMAEQVSVKGKEEEEARLRCVKSAPGLILNMIKRMTGADWFTAKISACAILPCAYQFFNCMKGNSKVQLSAYAEGDAHLAGGVSVEDIKSELRTMFRVLSEDDTPMVRRGAGKSLAKFVEAVANLPYGKKGSISGPVAKEFVIPGGKDEGLIEKTVSQDLKNKVFEEIVPIYQALSTDEQDSVRLLAVSASGSVGCALGLDAIICSQVVLPVIKAGSADLSW
jgi:serine/threonine-protein phosphatase 2A regulatory subunit A